jgi:predicted branched-subunit amino acid permease
MKHSLSCLKGDTIKAILLVCLAVGVVGMSYGSLAMAYGFPIWVPRLPARPRRFMGFRLSIWEKW